mmetsp:Transcript_6184/g.3491  ORF Transcript_6184/g.3491 Transcript_6184/m.3491 type:complete len:88 (-) Transcript_6184:488-751(-)
MDEWLLSHPENVAVVNCLAGKGRTGTVICCYLIYTKVCYQPYEAFDIFSAGRFFNGKGVQQPSQRRYVNYFSNLMRIPQFSTCGIRL